jgi:signal transduction histidine kinase
MTAAKTGKRLRARPVDGVEPALLLDTLPAFIYQRRLDARHTVCYASDGCRAITGYSPAALLDNHSVVYADLVHPDDRASFESAVMQALAAGSAYACHYRLRTNKGAYRWVIDSGSALCAPPDTMLAGVVVASPGLASMPATAREQAITRAVAAERARLARELHDTVTQSLFGVLLFADSGLRMARAGDNAELAGTFNQIESVGRQALHEMRLLLHRLRPSSLATTGLAGAIRDRLDSVEGSLGIAANVHTSGTLALDEAAEEALYYVALEALNNALKHSHAAVVSVRIRAIPGAPTNSSTPARCGAVLWVSDDGRGFDPAAALAGATFGLKNMRDRLAAVGGTIRFDSALGAGTRVAARVPPRRRTQRAR